MAFCPLNSQTTQPEEVTFSFRDYPIVEPCLVISQFWNPRQWGVYKSESIVIEGKGNNSKLSEKAFFFFFKKIHLLYRIMWASPFFIFTLCLQENFSSAQLDRCLTLQRSWLYVRILSQLRGWDPSPVSCPERLLIPITSKSCQSACFCFGVVSSVLYFPGSQSYAPWESCLFPSSSAIHLKEFLNVI